MQLFWLSPLILYPLWKWGRRFVTVILLLILLSMGCVFATFYTNNYKLRFMSMANGGDILGRFKKIYYPTHTRMGAYLVGVTLGYILHRTKDRNVSISWKIQCLGWLMSIGTILAIIFGQYPLQQIDAKENLIRDAFYESCSRVTWCVALGWIIFACVKGYGGIINYILTWSIWMPFARLSYSIYLTHFIIQMLLITTSRTTSYFNDINVYHSFWGDFGFALTVSIFWCLAFESPIVILEKYLIPSKLKNLVGEQTASRNTCSTEVLNSNDVESTRN